MRIGICGRIEEAARLGSAGFEHVELPAQAIGEDGAEGETARANGLAIVATNLFFDSTVRLFGPNRTPYLEYATRVIGRAARLGVRVMVIGSGGARRAEDGDGSDAAFVEIAAEIAHVARAHAVTIAPESLRREETNVGTDCGGLARALGAAGVGWTLDTYHALAEWERAGRPGTIEAMWAEAIPHAPTHLHLSSLSRGAPAPEDDLLVGALARLRDVGYGGDASLECNRGEGFDLAAAYRDTERLVRASGL